MKFDRYDGQKEHLKSPERKQMPIYAVDGIGGCGKSHVLKILAMDGRARRFCS